MRRPWAECMRMGPILVLDPRTAQGSLFVEYQKAAIGVRVARRPIELGDRKSKRGIHLEVQYTSVGGGDKLTRRYMHNLMGRRLSIQEMRPSRDLEMRWKSGSQRPLAAVDDLRPVCRTGMSRVNHSSQLVPLILSAFTGIYYLKEMESTPLGGFIIQYRLIEHGYHIRTLIQSTTRSTDVRTWSE